MGGLLGIAPRSGFVQPGGREGRAKSGAPLNFTLAGKEKEIEMSDPANERTPPDIDGRVRRAEKLVDHLIAEMEIYHAHKENMAHAGLLVMLAVLGGILGLPKWPADWIPSLSFFVPSRWTAFLGFFVLWGLLHVFIRWQLRNRRAAAITQAGAIRALVEWIDRAPISDDLSRYVPEATSVASPSPGTTYWVTWLDWVIPFPRPTLHPDVGKEDYPKWLGEALRQQEKGGTGAIMGEWLVTLGSFFVLVVAVVRTL